MHAYLITGIDEERIKKKTEDIINSIEAEALNFDLKKIKDVRELSSFTNLKVDKKTAIIIKDIDQASTASLNAFLKNLEEPQENVIYILTAKNRHTLPETIISRCTLLSTKKRNVDEKVAKEIKKFLNLSTENQLLYIEKVKKREDAIKFIENLILVKHRMLTEGADLKSAKLIKEASTTRKRLLANSNPTLQLTNFVLRFAGQG